MRVEIWKDAIYKKAEAGDVIECKGNRVEIKTITDQYYSMRNDFNTGEYWSIEFEDTDGNYRNWKSQFDGGKLIPGREDVYMKRLSCICEKHGYQYSNGTGGKRWTRKVKGERIMYSEGKAFYGNSDYMAVITKNNLETGKVEIAPLKEAKKFIKEDYHKWYTMALFNIKTLRGDI